MNWPDCSGPSPKSPKNDGRPALLADGEDRVTLMFVFMPLAGVVVMLIIVAMAPGAKRAQARRLAAVRMRYNVGGQAVVNEQVRKLMSSRAASSAAQKPFLKRIIPDPDDLRKYIDAAGRQWTVRQYFIGSGVVALIPMMLLLFNHAPFLMALIVGAAAGLGLPRFALGWLAKRRLNNFVTRFPDAIELLVRGLRAGMPIAETMGAVASEIEGPVGTEFQAVADRMKIGRTMEAALQETADRLGTPEFQFFVITLAIQRETGGNLAETLSNLSDVLRKRMQMKLKIAAMSSESKASAYIIGVLPFLVFGIISFISPDYMGQFFKDQRLMIAGMVGMIWMSIGAFIMRQMINFQI
jgi:tight adherence protein B